MECDCGSGLQKNRQFDARGIFLCSTCKECKDRKLRKYRKDVLNNPNYDCDEQIEPID